MTERAYRPPTKKHPGYRPQQQTKHAKDTTPHIDIYSSILHDWVIHPSLRYRLSNHFILHWKPSYLFSAFGENCPVTRDGIIYLSIYHNCSIAELKAAPMVLLSFRKLPDMKFGYVLISPVKSARQADYIDQTPASPSEKS